MAGKVIFKIELKSWSYYLKNELVPQILFVFIKNLNEKISLGLSPFRHYLNLEYKYMYQE